MTRSHDCDQLKKLASGRWAELLAELGGIDADLLDGQHHPCPKCGGTDRFRLINEEAGTVLCNQCFCEKNGDGIAALQWLNGWSFTETLEQLDKKLGNPSKATAKATSNRSEQRKTPEFWTREEAIAKAQEWASKAEKVDVGEPVNVYEFGPDAKGRIELEARFDFFKDGTRRKTTRPISRTNDMWQIKALHKPRPLYRNWDLDNNPNRQVIVCEGPKATDAAVSLGYVATTSPGGSGNAQKADWSPLAGREVAILPDADKPGQKYAHDVAEILTKLSPPAAVRIVELPGLEEGEDLVEWLTK